MIRVLYSAAQHGKHDICELIVSCPDRDSDDILEANSKGEIAVEAALSLGYKELACKLTRYAFAQIRAKALTRKLLLESDSLRLSKS